jgi:flavin-dependent dehydrogenase
VPFRPAQGSYGRRQALRPALSRMTRRVNSSQDGTHGTYFPYRLLSPTAGPLFVVGDAAGMCFGLTGEGIRPAMYFGEACGRIVRRGLSEDLSRESMLAQYAEFVRGRRLYFDALTLAQEVVTHMPDVAVDLLARIVSGKRLGRWLFEKYWGLTNAWDD